jgi:tetratricopeptide (TPR) repeat protein
MQGRFSSIARMALAVMTAWVAPLSAADRWPGQTTIGKWLVDLGRDYPLTPQAGLSDHDAEIALLFMEAAERVEPDLAEAIHWQVDLLVALGRSDEALEALRRYVRLWPEDTDAHETLVVAELEQLQTSEERRDFCLRYLERNDLPAGVIGELYRALAAYHWNRGDESQAREAAEQAVRAHADDVAAHALRARFTPDRDPLVVQAELTLLQLKSNPGDGELALNLADQLMLLNLAADAEQWYSHAIAVVSLVSPEAVPAEWQAGRAVALLAMGRIDEAERLAMRALERDPLSIEVLISRALIAATREDRGVLSRQLHQVGMIVDTLLAEFGGDDLPLGLAREAGWIYAHYLDRSDEARNMAQQLLENDPDDVIAQRMMGAVLLRRQQWDEAAEQLRPIADRDTWAAIERARALDGAGKREEAADQLIAAGRMPSTFEQRRLVWSLAAQWEIELKVTPPAAEGVRELLRSFPQEVLNYPRRPQAFLAVRLEGPAGDVQGAEPWWCTLRLENVGAFPITFGPEGMIDREVVCVVQSRGDRIRTSGTSIRMDLVGLYSLAPGQSFEVRQNVLLGAIRAGIVGTPQMSQEVEVTAVLNPIAYIEGDRTMTRPGIGGMRAGPAVFRRRPFVGSPANVQRLIEQATSAEAPRRIEAVQLLAMLLGEHQHLAAGRLAYPAQRIDAERVRQALLERAGDENWRVRAQLAESMRWFGVDRAVMPTATRLVNDEHWLVRGLARRMLSEQIGKDSETVLRGAAENDPDPWARRMSSALLGRLALTAPPADPAEQP